MMKNSSLVLLFILMSLVVASCLWLTTISQFPQQNRQVRTAQACLEQTLAPLPRVVLFGDSLTEHSFSHHGTWGAILADKLVRKADVINRGFQGYNTTMAKAKLPAIFSTFGAPIAAVTVLFGTNDAVPKTKKLHSAVPLEEYKNNLKWIVEYMKERGVGREKVVLISPPVFDPERWYYPDADSSVVDNYTAAYAKACGEVAVQLGCGFLDWNRMMNTEREEQWKAFLTDDGLHFSANGSKALADALWPLIEERTTDLPYTD